MRKSDYKRAAVGEKMLLKLSGYAGVSVRVAVVVERVTASGMAVVDGKLYRPRDDTTGRRWHGPRTFGVQSWLERCDADRWAAFRRANLRRITAEQLAAISWASLTLPQLLRISARVNSILKGATNGTATGKNVV